MCGFVQCGGFLCVVVCGRVCCARFSVWLCVAACGLVMSCMWLCGVVCGCRWRCVVVSVRSCVVACGDV